jgi:predicted DNA-binding transcriptional regulator AlpA
MEMKGEKRRDHAPGDPGDLLGRVTPLLVDANRGARIIGVSTAHFYKFIRRRRGSAPSIAVGSLNLWRREDLLRIMDKPRNPKMPEDILIDARTVAELCSISRSLVYKLNIFGRMPVPVLHGRTLRWSLLEIVEWVEGGCKYRGKGIRRIKSGGKKRGGKGRKKAKDG